MMKFSGSEVHTLRKYPRGVRQSRIFEPAGIVAGCHVVCEVRLGGIHAINKAVGNH